MNTTNPTELIINSILLDLMNVGDSSSQLKLSELCEYDRLEHINFIYERLIKQADTQSIYWLIKYLLTIEQTQGYEKLLLLTQQDNDFIRQESRQSLKNVPQALRVDLLLALLQSQWIDNVIYAAGELGSLLSLRAVAPLIDTIEKFPQEQKLILNAVKSLGRIHDRRAIKLLEKLLNHPNQEIQEMVLKALWNFSDFLEIKKLDDWLSKGDFKVKEFIYLKLVQEKDIKWQFYLAKKLTLETHEALKESFLSSVRSIRVKELFELILKLANQDSSYHVRMLADSILKKICSNQILQWLIEKEKKAQGSEKILILRLFFSYLSNHRVLEIFKEKFYNDDDQRIKLLSLEYIGRSNEKNAILFLIDIIKKDDLFSYAACLALTHKLKQEHWSLINKILSLDIEKRALCIQLILKFILRIHPVSAIPDLIENQLQRLAVCSSEDIRYLGIKALLRSTNPDKLYVFLLKARYDQSLKVRQAAQEAILHDLNIHAEKIFIFLSLGINDYQLIGTLSRVFKEVDTPPEQFLEVLGVLLDFVQKSLNPAHNEIGLRTMRIMVLLRHHIIKHKQLFLNLLAVEQWSQDDFLILIKVMNLTDINEYVGLNIDFLSKNYEQSSKEIKFELLKFFSKMKVRSMPIEKVLFSEMAQTKDAFLYERINQTVNAWVKDSQAIAI